MRPLSDILSEKEWVTANLKKAGLWCAGGLLLTIISSLLAPFLGFSIITVGAIGWGGWNIYKCCKKLDELKKEEDAFKKDFEKSSSDCIDKESEKKTIYIDHEKRSESYKKVSSLRSKTFK